MKNKIILIVFTMLILSGIETYRELSDIAIVSGISIDLNEKNEFEISAQILDSKSASKGSSSSKSDSNSSILIEYTSVGNTVQQALRKMIYESPKKLYLGHLELLVMSEDVVKKGLINSLDFFLRDNNVNKEFNIVISKDVKANKVINSVMPLESNPIENIIKSIKVSSKFSGKVSEETSGYIVSQLLEEGVEITLPSVSIEKSKDNNKEKSKVLISNLAYFRNKKFAGYVDTKDCITHNLVNGKVKKTILEAKLNNDFFAAELYNLKSSIRPRKISNEYILDINVTGKALITEISQSLDITTEKDVFKYKEIIDKQIEENINVYIDNCKNKYKSDIIGVEAILYKKLHKDFIKLSGEEKKNIFKKVNTNVNVDIKLNIEGEIINEGK